MRALVRLSPEITTKAPKTRTRFIRTLVSNLKTAFKVHEFVVAVERSHSRIFLEFENPAVLEVACRVFGVLSISPCRILPYESLEKVVEQGVELMSERVRGKTFAVRARARDPLAGLRSQQINEKLGEALCEFAKVDLSNPDVTVQLELRDGEVAFYTDTIKGHGGIPIGEGGRAVVLLSAGFDSAVAAFLMLRRGVHVEFASCRLGGDPHAKAVLAVANRITEQWMCGIKTRLWQVPLELPVETLRKKVEERYRQLVLKRLMYRVAEEVCHRVRADAFITGEALGQVSSQTLRNLRALEERCYYPVLRPLLTTGKVEIVHMSKVVGTQHLSSGVPEYCALGSRPATAARSRDVHREEDRLDEFDAKEIVNLAEVVALPHTYLGSEGIVVTEVAEHQVVLDLRTPPERKKHPLANAREVDAVAILRQPDVLQTDGEYVVACDSGSRSAWFARELRTLGFQAFVLSSSVPPEG